MKKIRHLVSERFLEKEKHIGNQNERAVSFKRAATFSSSMERLDAELSIKAAQVMGNSIGGDGTGKKPTYEDTDNKKRDFGGDLAPGLESRFGYIFNSSADGMNDDSKLKLLSPNTSRAGASGQPNFGWIKNEKSNPKPIELQPQIVLRKYKVNPRTDDIIQSSEETLNPFSKFSGVKFDARNIPTPNSLNKQNGKIQTKKLPGRPLSSRIPGGGLLSRAAAAIGIIRDAANKYRCPPGTPAANQYTDINGSTCFGTSITKLGKFIQDKAVELTDAGEMQGFKRFVNRSAQWLRTGSWDDDQGLSDRPINRLKPYVAEGSASIGWDPVTGTSISPDWSTGDVPPDMRVFANGMANAQRKTKEANEKVESLSRALGVDNSSKARATNKDLVETFDKLKETGQWDLQIDRPTEGQIEDSIRRKISAIMSTGAYGLSPEEVEKLVRADLERYYATERAIMVAQLENFIQMPEVMRNLKIMQLHMSTSPGASEKNDEGGFFFSPAPPGSKQKIIPTIEYKIDIMMLNQEAALPKMKPNERLFISAVGGASDAERMTAVADFLTRADEQAKNVAGLSGGVEAWSRHVGLHEIGHFIQGMAFFDVINRQIEATGSFKYTDGKGKLIEIDDIRKLKSTQLMDIMVRINDTKITDVKALEKLNNVFGSYPDTADNPGVRTLEAQTELWALRAAGLIQGDDVDNALDYMDEFSGDAMSDGRTRVGKEYIKSIKDGEIAPAGKSMIDIYDTEGVDISPEKMPSRVGEKSIEERRKMLSEIGKMARDPERTSEEDLIRLAAIASAESSFYDEEIGKLAIKISSAETRLKKLKAGKSKDESIKKLEEMKTKLEVINNDKAFADEKYKKFKNGWSGRFSIGEKGSSLKFEELVFSHRKERGMLSAEEVKLIASREKIEKMSIDAKKMKKSSIIDEIAAIELKYAMGTIDSPEDLINTNNKHQVLVDEYIDRAIADGDKRKRSQIRKELINKIEEKVSPKPKPVKKFKTATATKEHASKERKALRRKLTKSQAEAARAMGDFNSKDVAKILDPDNNASAGRAMNRANARLKRLGLKPDSMSTSDGSMEEQVQNILAPTLEAMDISSVSEPFEMEVIMDVMPGELTGRSLGKEIDSKTFSSGVLIAGKHKKAEISSKTNPITGKKQRRVIVSVKEGDRGIFPTIKDDGKQSFVIPPGKLRVIGRDKDGTIRVEISSQKGTTEVLDELAKDVAKGPGDAIWRKSAARKIQQISDKRIIDKPERLSSGRNSDSKDGKSVTKNVMDNVSKSGGSFGEYSKTRDELKETSLLSDLSPEAEYEMLEFMVNPSGPPRFTRLGNPNRPEIKKRMRSLKRELSQRDGKPWESKSERMNNELRESVANREIDEPVQKLLELPPQEMQQALNRSAVEYHMGLDKRPRVRMRETELDEFSKSGKMRATTQNGSTVVSGPTRRAERLSSGATKPMSRKDKEKLIGKNTKEQTERILKDIPELEFQEINPDTGIKWTEAEKDVVISNHLDAFFASLTSEQLASLGISRLLDDKSGGDNVENQKVSGTTGQPIYRATSVETVLSLISLGQTVLHDDGLNVMDSRMVPESGKQVEKLLKEVMQLNAKGGLIRTLNMCKLYTPGVNMFCSENMSVDRNEMPQVGGRSVNPESVGLRMWVSKLMDAEVVEAHKINGDNYFARELQEEIKKLAKEGKKTEADELQRKLSILQSINDGFSPAAWTQDELNGDATKNMEIKIPVIRDDGLKTFEEIRVDVTPEEARALFAEFGITVTAKEQKRLAEIRNANARDSTKPGLTDEQEALLMVDLDFAMVEPDGVDLFATFLTEKRGVAVKKPELRPVESLKASQRELDGGKVDGIAENIGHMTRELMDKGKYPTPESRQKRIDELRITNGLFKKIIVSNDGYILDGHHRIIGKKVQNNIATDSTTIDGFGVSADDLEILGVTVIEADMSIVELLHEARVFQDLLGIKPASLVKGAEETYKPELQGVDKIKVITKDAVDDLVNKFGVNVDSQIDLIYENGTFIQVDAVGYKSEKGKRYLGELLSKKEDRSARARARRFSSGAVSREKGGDFSKIKENARREIEKTIDKTNIDTESKEKLLFAFKNIIDYKKGSSDASLLDFAEKLNYVSGETITQLALEHMVELELITDMDKVNLTNNMSSKEPEGFIAKKSFLENAFFDAAQTLSESKWTLSQNTNTTGRTVGKNSTNLPRDESSGAERTGRFGFGSSNPTQPEQDFIPGTSIPIPLEQDFLPGTSIPMYEEEDGFASYGRRPEAGARPLPRDESAGAERGKSLKRNYWNSIGLNDEIDDDSLPVSGYMVHESHIKNKRKKTSALLDDDSVFELEDSDIVGDGLTAQGEIEIVLKPEVADRTSYGKGGALKNGHKPVLVNSTSPEDISQALTSDKFKNSHESIVNLLGYSLDKDGSSVNSKKPKGAKFKKVGEDLPDDFEHEQIQAHILGGFDKDEIESINYPFSKIEKLAETENIDDVIEELSIAETLRKAGFTEAEIAYFYQISGNKQINTQSMRALRQQRAAKKVRDKYKAQGFSKINFAHPRGENIDNPKTFNINANSKATVEDTLKEKIRKEIIAEAKSVLQKMNKNRKLTKSAENDLLGNFDFALKTGK